MSFNHSLSSCHTPKVRDLLKNSVAVGSSVAITGQRAGICVGFAEKYIHRGGLDHKHAGVYIDFATAIVRPSDGGQSVLVPLNLGSLHEIVDINIRIADLPETPFWEGDIVKNQCQASSRWVIKCIEYHSDCKHIYHLQTPSDAGTGHAFDSTLTLVARGNLWKLDHGEPLVFASIEDEAKFYKSLGMSRKVCQSVDQTHARAAGFVDFHTTEEWDFKSAISCLHEGRGDAIKVKDRKNMTFVVIKYDLEEFGGRMRTHTLAKFGLAEETTA